jgi:hypothetical protein
MKKLIAIIALTSGMGAAYADQPVALNDAQMDNVSAGALASTAEGLGLATALYGATQVVATANTAANVWGTSANVYVRSNAIGALPASAAAVSATSIKY